MTDNDTDIRIDKFTVRQRIGRGGMGAVYEGHDPALDRRVAIKTLTADVIADQDSRSRFEREARAAAKLQHPNIVTIYELGNFGGAEKPYIVMEYLEGTDVASLIGDEGMPIAEAPRYRHPAFSRSRFSPPKRRGPSRHQASQPSLFG